MREQPESSMSSSGSPRRGGILLIVTLVAVVVALLVTLQVGRVLFAIVFPPSPPLPAGITELEHIYEQNVPGVDAWVYASTTDACQMARFYEQQGGSCRIAPEVCTTGVVRADVTRSVGENVAQCTGEGYFSIFAFSWEAIIATGYRDDYPTRLRLSREIYWTGSLPRPTPVPTEELPTPAATEATN